MKSLTNYVSEKLIVNKNYNIYKYSPKTPKELRQIIIDRFEELGSGTKNKPINFNDIDVSRMDTFHNDIENCGLFEYSKFEYIDISNWDVSNVKNMTRMFYRCRNLKSVGDLSNWDVSKVENISNMFTHCKNLKSIGDISNWDISNVKNMRYMFFNSAITNIPDWS